MKIDRLKNRWNLILAALMPLISSCGSEQWHSSDGAVWATTYHIVYRSSESLDDSIQTVFNEINNSLSPFVDNSLVSRINRNEVQEVDSLFKEVFTVSQTVNRLSDGMFDPTVSPAINLWGFGYKKGPEPDSLIIDSLKKLVGIGECVINEGMLTKKSPGTEFNFSAIAKGFGCDRMAEMFRRNGVTDFMVEIGGEIAVRGENSSGEDWRIMIVVPEEGVDGQNRLTVSLSDCGMATSGNYNNFRDTSEGRIGHTIDPATCRPVMQPVYSATVIASSTILADALATACMVMPPEKSIEVVEGIPDAELLLIIEHDDVYKTMNTNGFKEYLHGNKKP